MEENGLLIDVSQNTCYLGEKKKMTRGGKKTHFFLLPSLLSSSSPSPYLPSFLPHSLLSLPSTSQTHTFQMLHRFFLKILVNIAHLIHVRNIK